MKKSTLIFVIVLALLSHSLFSQEVTCGAEYSAIICDSAVVTWGANEHGQLGNGTWADSFIPFQIALLKGVIAIEAGKDHTLALTADGLVYSWGSYEYGKLGIDTTADINVPQLVVGIDNIIAISAGGGHSLALRSDSTVWSWGANTHGQLGTGANYNYGSNPTPSMITSLTGVTSIAAGGVHSLAVKSDGSLWAWGNLGQGTNPFKFNTPILVSSLTNVQKVSAGFNVDDLEMSASTIMKNDSTVWFWGHLSMLLGGYNGTYLSPVQINDENFAPITNAIDIFSIGDGMNYILTDEDSLYFWGFDQDGSNDLFGSYYPEASYIDKFFNTNEIALMWYGNYETYIVSKTSNGEILTANADNYYTPTLLQNACPACLLSEITSKNTSCNSSSDGSISISIIGDDEQIDYIWSTGSANENMIENLSIGSYQVTISNPNGCTEIKSVDISVEEFYVSLGLDKYKHCEDTLLLAAKTNGNVDGINFQWHGEFLSDTLVSAAKTWTPDTAEFIVIATIDTTCFASDTVRVFPRKSEFTLGNDLFISCGSSAQLQASIDVPRPTLEIYNTTDTINISGWSAEFGAEFNFPSGVEILSGEELQYYLCGTSVDVQDYIVLLDYETFCDKYEKIYLSEYQGAIAAIVINSEYGNGIFPLQGDGSYSDFTSIPVIMVGNNDGNLIKSMLTNGNTGYPDYVDCIKNAYVKTTTYNNISYNWFPATNLNNGTISNPIATPNLTETYSLDMGACFSPNIDSVKVFVNQEVNFQLDVSANQTLFTTPPFIVQFTNNTPSLSNYTFTWDFGDGASVTNNNGSIFHEYLFNGLFTVSLIAENNDSGCKDTLVKSDYIFTTGGASCSHTAYIENDETSVCEGDSIRLSATSYNNYTYEWKLNGFTISGAEDSIFYAKESGSYSVIIYNETACPKYSDGLSLSFVNAPNAPSIVPNGTITFCSGGSVELGTVSSYDSYLWSTGGNAQSEAVFNSGIYSVTVSNAQGCTNVGEYQLNSSLQQSPDICLVGVDNATSKNTVVWEKPISTGVDSFLVFKETNQAEVYAQIGAVQYNDLSVFVDDSSNPAVQAFRYKLAIKDTCGSVTLLSDLHKTIHLTINQGVGQTWNLIWTHYEGIVITSYNIYRGTSTSNMSLLTTIAGNLTSYTDLTPPTGLLYYQIELVISDDCNPTFQKAAAYNSSKSNIVENGENPGTGIWENNPLVGIGIFPNPTFGQFSLSFISDSEEQMELKLYSSDGKLALTQKMNPTKGNNIFTVDSGYLSIGIYFAHINSGQYSVVKKVTIY